MLQRLREKGIKILLVYPGNVTPPTEKVLKVE